MRASDGASEAGLFKLARSSTQGDGPRAGAALSRVLVRAGGIIHRPRGLMIGHISGWTGIRLR
jgi:hypothetical protein